MLRGMWFWGLAILGSGLSLGLYWATDLPLGVPSEWSWGRFGVTPDLFASAITCLVSGAAYLTVVAWGFRRLARPECPRTESFAWQAALAVAAGVWIWTVQGTGTTGPTVGRWPFVLYYPSSSGYFSKARYDSPQAREFLRQYEDLMKEGDVLHVGTHPPGLFLFFHGLIGLMESSPAIVSAVNATQPAAVREAFGVIQQNSVRANSENRSPITAGDQAVLWFAGLIGFALSAATVWPLYGFVRQYVDRPASWLCASVWPLVPAVSMFLPKSDVAFAFSAMLLGWIWIMAWRRQSIGLAGLAGAIWTVSILCSLAFLPVALWLALLSLIEAWPALRSGRQRDELFRALRTIVPAGVVCLSMMAALSVWGNIPLWKTYWLNYRNHAGFYVEYPRTYLAWLAVNPCELACAVGFPLFTAAGCGIISAIRSRIETERKSLIAPCLATLVVWTWLWLSGKNSGEAARLWIFLMPYLVACTAGIWASEATRSPRRASWIVWCWLALQAIVCFCTVQRVNGFAL